MNMTTFCYEFDRTHDLTPIKYEPLVNTPLVGGLGLARCGGGQGGRGRALLGARAGCGLKAVENDTVQHQATKPLFVGEFRISPSKC